jgi:hypothetical protein
VTLSGLLAFVSFLLAFVFHGFGFHGGSWVSPVSLLYLGLVFLALHVSGAGLYTVPARRQ